MHRRQSRPRRQTIRSRKVPHAGFAAAQDDNSAADHKSGRVQHEKSSKIDVILRRAISPPKDRTTSCGTDAVEKIATLHGPKAFPFTTSTLFAHVRSLAPASPPLRMTVLRHSRFETLNSNPCHPSPRQRFINRMISGCQRSTTSTSWQASDGFSTSA
jgi:hypothetical protein